MLRHAPRQSVRTQATNHLRDLAGKALRFGLPIVFLVRLRFALPLFVFPIESSASPKSKPNNSLIRALSAGITRLFPTVESSSTMLFAKAATSDFLRAPFVSRCA